MEQRSFLPVLRRWWWTLVLATVVSATAGYLVAASIAPTYEASAELLVGPVNTDADTLRAASQLGKTYAELAESRPLAAAAATELGPAFTERQVRSSTSASANDITRILTIRATSEDREQAAQIANALAVQLEEFASRGLVQPAGEVQVVDPAPIPNAPIAPQKSLITLLAGVTGVLAAMALVLVADRLNDTVRTDEDVRDLHLVDILGTVATRTSGPIAPFAVQRDPASRLSATYRLLSAKLGLTGGTQPRIIQVAGARENDGAAEVAGNLAAAMAGGGRRVLLIDADLDQRELTERLALADEEGIGELLAHAPLGSTTEGASLPAAGQGLTVLPAGLDIATRAIDPQRVAQTVKPLVERFDVVVVASGPVNRAPDALGWAQVADVTTLVVRRHVTARPDLADAVEALRLVDAVLAGVVVTEKLRRRMLGDELWPDATPSVRVLRLPVAGERTAPSASVRSASVGGESA